MDGKNILNFRNNYYGALDGKSCSGDRGKCGDRRGYCQRRADLMDDGSLDLLCMSKMFKT